MWGKLFSLVGEMNGQLLTVRQQQASSMNALDVLTNDVAGLSEKVKKITTGSAAAPVSGGGRGGSRGRGSRGSRGGGNRGNRGRGSRN
jgi:hypothetical protein